MSGLTDEQRRRMEENRLKALQKRLKKNVTGDDSGEKPQPTPSGSSIKSSISSNINASSSNTFSSYAIDAKRIEENRRKALERRAAQQKIHSANASQIVHSPNKSTFLHSDVLSSKQSTVNQPSALEKPPTSFYKTSQLNQLHQSSVSKFNAGYCDNVKNNNIASTSGKTEKSYQGLGVSPTKLSTILNQHEKCGKAPLTGMKPVFGKTVNGTFILQSLDRFIVNVGYHKEMIEVFKTMTTKQYDAVTCKWSFSISEHDQLVTALKPLRPAVCISPLPGFVRKAVKSSSHQVPASCVDLFGLDPKLLDALMPFQHDGVCFGVSCEGRVMFADDMGLGKTIQALGVAAYYRREWPMLVVTPSSVRYSWAHSIERWVGSVSPADIAVVNSGRDHLSDAEVVIMSYDLLSRRGKEILDRNFQVVIMDESHMLKSFKTARYKAAAPIMKRAKRVMMLSGTPALSRPSELYTQITGLCPNLFQSFQEYGVRYCDGKQHQWGWDFSGSSHMEELEIILKSKIMIRRLKSQVLDQLPAKQRMTVILDPASVESGTKAMEAAVKKLGLKTLHGLEKQGALFQFFAETATAKLKAVSEYIKELLESNKKFLVFAHHQVMLDKLCSTCDSAKIRYIRIDGRTNAELRQNLVMKFQTNDDVRVAVLSITAANSGVTLTAAQLVVFAELFWNPGVLVQAEDRVHRIGQQDCVMVQYLVAKHTADDFIWTLVQSKLEVLGKAGLSKDNFHTADSVSQKGIEQESILKYFSQLENDDCLENSSDEPQTKKQKM